MKQIFRVVTKTRTPLLDMRDFKANKKKHVIIYGACSHMGTVTANLMIKYGYSVLLVDPNLQKMQNLKLQLLRTYLEQFEHPNPAGQTAVDADEADARIRLMAFDISKHMDSTSLEKYLRQFVPVEGVLVPVIVNCSGFGGYWQVCEDKLFHELQFDQLAYFQAQTMLGYSIILQFFCRLVYDQRSNFLILNIQKRPIRPSDRRPLALKVLRICLRPDLFSDIMERVNVVHFGAQAWLEAVTEKLRLSYPMISHMRLLVDHRKDKIYSIDQLEAELKTCFY